MVSKDSDDDSFINMIILRTLSFFMIKQIQSEQLV